MPPRTNLEFDASLETIFVSNEAMPAGRAYFWETPNEVVLHFANLTKFWQKNCGQQKVYIVVDFTHATFSPALIDLTKKHLEQMLKEVAITIVRYGGTLVQRSATRLVSIRMHTSSHCYANREEAVEVVRMLRSGKLKVA